MINLAKRFKIDSPVVSVEPYGNGHINETYLVNCESGHNYILQRINTEIFKDPAGLMKNIELVTAHIWEKMHDPRRVLRIVPSATDEPCFTNPDGQCWRMYDFIEDSICLDICTSANDFYQSARGFGEFQNQLADFPAETLSETIPHFHDTPVRYQALHAAVESDPLGRVAEVLPEIEFAFAREAEAATMVTMLANGELPLRVTHNDTKLNNVMLDSDSHEPICVIDLDTVMPGLIANDYGDSIRFGASTGAEDEPDLSKVEMSLELFEAYTRGFLSACGARLTAAEIDTLPLGAKLMTLECGIRFLADHIVGDTYFRIHRPGHNLDRARTQFKLVADMELKAESMRNIVEKIKAELKL